MAGEDEVLRGLAPARARVGIRADEPGALTDDQRAAVVGLADDGIGGGEVADERGARLGVGDRGRVGNPEVLADLDRHDERRQVVAGEELPHAKRHVDLAGDVDHGRVGRSGREVTPLVELVVGGNVALGHHAEDGAGRDGDGAVVELGVDADGHAEKDEGVVAGRPRGDLGETGLGGVEKGVLPEEVLAGVSRDAELRQDDDLGAMLGAGIVDPPEDRLDVEGDVRNPNLGRHGRDRHESILHGSLLGRAQ